MRCKLVCLSVVLCLALSAMPSGLSAEEPPARPNFILCMADDQGWGDVAYNGHSDLKTPTLDEMSRQGLRFNRFYAAAPVCSPTRGGVLTGRHPNRFGCFSWGYPLRPQEVTVAEALRSAGYATGHFGKWHLGSVRAGAETSPGAQGFDEWVSSPNFFENNPRFSHNGKAIRSEGEGSQVTVEAALKFIRDAAERRQPFLAVIWFGSPHAPHEALPEDREPYKKHSENLQNYYGEITAMDRGIGQLRRELRRMGIARDTLLWYTSDNGAQGPGSTGGLSGKKGSLWEGGIRVPALLEWPAKINSPRSVMVPCCSTDISPTLLELAGATVPNQPRPLDGVSLTPLLEGRLIDRQQPMGFWVYPKPGRAVRGAEILAQLEREQSGQEPPREGPDPDDEAAKITRQYAEDKLPGHAAWIDNEYKLHRIPKDDGDVTYKLFNLTIDFSEKTDLAPQQPERVEKMKRQLEQWQKSVVRSLNGEDY